MLILASPLFIHAQEQLKNGQQYPQDSGSWTNAIKSGILSSLAKGISYITVFIAYVFGYLAGLVFTFAGLFLSFGLKLNGSLLQSPTVNIGWSITRDLANLGFVLAIIFIAIATILRSNKYGMKKILWRLIAVAILINFSLTFAGILIDASGLMTNFFMAKVVPPAGGTSFSNLNSQSMAFSAVLANAFGIQKALDTKSLDAKKIQSASEFGATTFTLIANMFFVVLFTIMGATVMLATAALVFVRYVALMILLILMPLAWLGWIFEGSAFYEAFQQWWKTFIEWLIWLPAAMFFIYLTILIVVNQSQDANSVTQIAKSIQTAPQGNVLDQFLGFTGPPTTGLVGVSGGSQGSGGSFETFGQMLAVLGLMSGGLIMARRISDKGAKIVLGFAGQAQGYLLGKVKGAAQKTAGYGTGYYASQYAGGRLFDRYMRKEDSKGQTYGQKLSTGLAKVGFGGTASALSNYLAGNKSSYKQEVLDYQKQYLSNLTNETLKAYPSKFRDPKVLAAVGAEMIKRNILPEDDEKINLYIKAAKDAGLEKDLINNRPDLAPKFGKTIEEVMKKLGDITAVANKAFEDVNVLGNLTSNHIKTLGNSDKVSQELKEAIKKNITKIGSDIIKFKTSGGQLTDEQKTMEKKLSYMRKLTNTPGWSIGELQKTKREEIGEFKTSISEQVRDIRSSAEKETRSAKEKAREAIEDINRRANIAQPQKDLEIQRIRAERDNKIAQLEKSTGSQVGRLDKSRLAADEKLRKEVEEINKLFKNN